MKKNSYYFSFVLIFIFIMIIFSGCTDENTYSLSEINIDKTMISNISNEKLKKANKIGMTELSGPFEITLNDAVIADYKITKDFEKKYFKENNYITLLGIDISVENTSNFTNKIYPNKSKIILNNKEIISDSILSDPIGGNYISQVNKQGVIFFVLNENKDNIESLSFIIDSPTNKQEKPIGNKINFNIDFD